LTRRHCRPSLSLCLCLSLPAVHAPCTHARARASEPSPARRRALFLISIARTSLLLERAAIRACVKRKSGRDVCSPGSATKPKSDLPADTLKFHSRGRAIAAGFSRSNVFKPTTRPLTRARARARCHTTCHLISAITLLLPIKNRKRHEAMRKRASAAERAGGSDKERRLAGDAHRATDRDSRPRSGAGSGCEDGREGQRGKNEWRALFRARASVRRG